MAPTTTTPGAKADIPPPAVVLRCRQGDPAAQRELYVATCGWIYRLVFRMVGRNDAEDVCQQVYLRVFTKIGGFDGKAEFNTWLYRVAVNEALQHLRRRRPTVMALDREIPGEDDETGGYALRELLEKALAQIDPDLRTVFLLRESERLSYREIADMLHIPEGTVASRISRARAELQTILIRLG